MGRLIAIDGVDASGKQTHAELLYEKLKNEGIYVRKVSFPAYDKPSSALVKMYLSGEFGKTPGDVSAYAASSFFAADRFATFRTDWGKEYNDGAVIIADRYVSSNMIHQASKLEDVQKAEFLDWLDSLEYEIYGLPRPDVTVFLDMPPEYGAKLMKDRDNKFSGTGEKDIHERDYDYLLKSYENACFVAEKYNWQKISCVRGGEVRTIEEINDELYKIVKNITGDVQ